MRRPAHGCARGGSTAKSFARGGNAQLFYEPLLTFALRRAVRIVASPHAGRARASRYRAKCTVIPFGSLPNGTTGTAIAAQVRRSADDSSVLLFVDASSITGH
jgi:hypothetical protein